MVYGDRNALRLLDALAEYAEAFKKDHTDPELTVKALADDLVTMDDYANVAKAEDLRDRVYDGLNNVDHV